MSYTVFIFHADVRRAVTERGVELDGFAHPPLPPAEVQRLRKRLPLYGYVSSAGNADEPSDERPLAFSKARDGSTIDVRLFRTEAAFSIATGGSQDLLFELLQDASELADGDDVALWNPQDGSWGPPDA